MFFMDLFLIFRGHFNSLLQAEEPSDLKCSRKIEKQVREELIRKPDRTFPRSGKISNIRIEIYIDDYKQRLFDK